MEPDGVLAGRTGEQDGVTFTYVVGGCSRCDYAPRRPNAIDCHRELTQHILNAHNIRRQQLRVLDVDVDELLTTIAAGAYGREL